MHVDQPFHDGADAGDQRRLVEPSIGEGRVVGGVDDSAHRAAAARLHGIP